MISKEEALEGKDALNAIVDNVETVIIGKRNQVEFVTLALIARGHVLLEDVPGTGKTSLVLALAKSIDCDFKRIQFTPDIMPSDVTGFSIYNQKTNEFEFRPGAILSNFVLADEINRASAKTQSALLEAMEERQITVDSQTYKLEEPFMVMATQNPLEQFGTYPLPEAQVDRFLIKLSLGYPSFHEEEKVVKIGKAPKENIAAVVTGADVLDIRRKAEGVHLSDTVISYLVQIVTATRNNAEVKLGSSPRGCIALAALGRAYALLQGRNYVLPDDIKYVAPYVLGHRIALTHEARVNGRTERQVIDSILSAVAVPFQDDEEIQGLKELRPAEMPEEDKTIVNIVENAHG
jgi:MoxR-like ATPase